jgi:hypothetical protein
MLLICPTAQAKRLRHVGTTGKSGRRRKRKCQCGSRSSRPGIAVRRTASLPLAYDPAIHVLVGQKRKTWITGTSPVMTTFWINFAGARDDINIQEQINYFSSHR